MGQSLRLTLKVPALRDLYLDNVAFHSQAKLGLLQKGEVGATTPQIKRLFGFLLQTIRLPAWVTVSVASAGEVSCGQYWLNSCPSKV